MALIEVRYYAAQELISRDEAVRCYDAILGEGLGLAFADGSKARRHELLEPLVTGTEK